MNFKIDTKEKMHVIKLGEAEFSAIMAEEVVRLCNSFLKQPVKNVILDFENVESVQQAALTKLSRLQEAFMLSNASLVFCCFQDSIKKQLEELDLLDVLNVTPTQSEAWDIVQMEEVERELLGE